MNIRQALAEALKELRLRQQLTQEDFALISSRTYISLLERAERAPTLEKLDAIARHMNIHPLTLIVLIYQKMHPQQTPQDLMEQVMHELAALQKNSE